MSKNSNKTRVLHILPNFTLGGAELLVKNLLLFSNREKFESAACSLFPKGFTTSSDMIETELEENNIKLFYLNKSLGPDLKIIINLYRLFKSFRPQVIHIHLYILAYTLLPALLCRIPVRIHTVHSVADNPDVPRLSSLSYRLSYKLFRVQPIGISPVVSRSVEKLYNIPTVPFIYNGIPTNSYNHDRNNANLNLSFKLPDNKYVIIHVGRFTPAKNHRLLIKAFARVVAEMPEAILLLVGDGELKSEIQSLANLKNLSDKVKFLGFRKDIPELLAISDLFVLSSDWEGGPLVVMEAMAAGKPVVATPVGCVPDMISDNVNGLIVKPKDVNSLAKAILQLAKDYPMAQKMGELGRQIAREKFDIKITTRRYEGLYENLLNKIPV